MTTYLHLCEDCNHEWEQVYGMKENPPTICPQCNVEGCVKRLISGGSGPGIMRKTTSEIKSSMAIEQRKTAERAKTDEKFAANIVGEERYHNSKLQNDALTKELIGIGKDVVKIKSTDVKPSVSRPKIKTSKNSK